MSLKNIDVVILCGGLGKRLRTVVADRPKPMVEIDHRPFLDILIDYVASYGFKRFILCTGYMGDVIKHHYQSKRDSLDILFSEEKEPLGTGGAIKNAESLIQSNPILVMNGDSFCEVELNKFVVFHLAKEGMITIVLACTKEPADYGLVTTDLSGQIIGFSEKQNTNGKQLVNAGVYLMERGVLSLIPSNIKYSLEYDLFPAIHGMKVFGYATEKNLIDIGTPERYETAKQVFSNRRA